MSNKKLALILVGIFFALILISVASIFVLNSDISKAELGPSPFIVDESVVAENNAEYLKLVKIGKEIKGLDEFNKGEEIDLKNLGPYILKLQILLQKNEGIIEKFDVEFFRKFKFEKFDLNINNDDNSNLSNFLWLLRHRIECQIFTRNFEGAKNDLVLMNHINSELLKKPSCLLVGMIILANKTFELKVIRLLVGRPSFTEDQKLEILKITQAHISSDFLKLLAHFEIEFFQDWNSSYLRRSSKYSRIFKEQLYYPLYTPFMNQTNKSVKIFRQMAIDIIDKVEKGSNSNYKSLNDKPKSVLGVFDFINGNYEGKKYVNSAFSILNIVFVKVMVLNSIIDQHIVAEKILSYKLKEGVFPPTLADLGIDKAVYTDILTGNDFLYSAENGILQSIGKDGKNDNIELTTKILSPNEIHDILNDDKGECIFYLK